MAPKERRGFVRLHAAPGVKSFSSQFGTYYTDDDETMEVPEGAIDLAASHGLYRTKALLAKAMEPPKKVEDAVVGKDGIVRVEHHHHYHGGDAPADDTPKKTLEEVVAGQDRFALREYCEGNGITIPPRTSNEALKALVLAHMKAEAAGELLPTPGDGDKEEEAGEGEGEPEASEK